MLKKLVKYGNSNALILDKAILELLNIEEGSVIKITTDGASLTITPHTQSKSGNISDPFTHNQATIDATVKELFKQYKGLPTEKQGQFAKELQDLMQKHHNLHTRLFNNPDFVKEITDLKKTIDASSPAYREAYKTIRNRYAPDLVKLEKEIAAFETKNNLVEPKTAQLSKKQQKAMEDEFAMHFKTYGKAHTRYAELLNNPEYQHEAQCIAEQYNGNKDSAEYLNAMNELAHKYNPEILKSQEALKAIAKKYSTK